MPSRGSGAKKVFRNNANSSRIDYLAVNLSLQKTTDVNWWRPEIASFGAKMVIAMSHVTCRRNTKNRFIAIFVFLPFCCVVYVMRLIFKSSTQPQTQDFAVGRVSEWSRVNHHSKVENFVVWKNIPSSSLLQGTFDFVPHKSRIYLLWRDLFWMSTIAGVPLLETF